MSFDDVSQTDLKMIALISSNCQAPVRADSEAEFSSLSLYALYDELYWSVSTDALVSQVWQSIIAFNDIDLANFGTFNVKHTRHVATAAKGLHKFTGGPLIEDDVHVDMCRYRVYSERLYVTYQ